jgi:hypothetical protein
VTEIIIYTQGPQDEILLALTQKFRKPYHTESWSAFNLDNSPFTASLTEWRVGRFNLELAVIGTDAGKITANNDVLTFDGQ